MGADLLRWLDQLSRTDAFTDERARMQARFIGAGSVAGLGVSALAAIVLGAQGSWSDAAPSVAGCLLCVATLGLWRATRSRAVIGHVFATGLSSIYVASALGSGDVTYVAAYVLVPTGALFLAGRRAGTVWLVTSVALVVGIGAWLRPAEGLARHAYDTELLRTLVIVPTVFLIVFLYDLSHERALATMSLAREAAEAANREKSRFLAKVSHEIRTPLNGVLGTAELALLEEQSPAVRAHLTTIHRSGGTLLALINDLLDLARAEEGRFELANAPFLPTKLANDVVELHRARAGARGLVLEARSELGPTLRLSGDAVRLRQVLGNLVSNAIKFTPSGSVIVRCDGQPDGARFTLRMTVTDTGPGISAEDQKRLFEPFTQLASTDEGTGLGLAISRQVVEAMRGRLLLSSEAGKGSTFGFEVTLPLSDGELEHTPVGTVLRFNGNVLVVDDNPVNVQVASGLLGKLGVEVTTAKNGQEALELMRAKRFDLVLLDLQMPVLDGLATTQALRARGDQTPVVALTANAMQDDLARCLEAGMQECLTKPVRLARLVELLLRVLPENRQGLVRV